MKAALTANVKVVVTQDAAVFSARMNVRALAAYIGFEREVIEELVVVVSELTTNILKYGRRGHIELTAIARQDGLQGISIVAQDETPPFDLRGSLRDGYDAAGKLDPALVFGRRGIGAGLGAVARLSDSVDLEPHGSAGKRILVRRFLGPPRRGSRVGS